MVADGLGDAHEAGVRIVDAGKLAGRVQRMVRSTRRVLAQACQIDASIYHLHDPELIPAGLQLKRMGKTVIFDAHEDVPMQLLSKPYLNRPLRHLASRAFTTYEAYACRQFDGIIAATPFIAEKFRQINPRTVAVNNFPLLAEFDAAAPWEGKQRRACYVGSIAAVRGIRELVRAFALLRCGARLALAGQFSEPALEAEVRNYHGWNKVDSLGQQNRAGVRAVMAGAMAGLVTLHPERNYLDALPVKMFEYMAAGIPVIASDFPLWRAIVDRSGCGLCVDPLDPVAIAGALDQLITQPELARAMGQNGRRAILDTYNWATESVKLLAFYAQLRAQAPG
ncbi:Glycosyltransferase involved in cell wall bisynthesis [Massilia sp. CF038]|nr:Glycosyltransferase involved in cell wall bisynthesis [Massilia sp. CF038]